MGGGDLGWLLLHHNFVQRNKLSLQHDFRRYCYQLLGKISDQLLGKICDQLLGKICDQLLGKICHSQIVYN